MPGVPKNYGLSGTVGSGMERMSRQSDRSLAYVAQQAAKLKQPIRVRFTTSLFDPKSKQYKGWRGQVWKVPVKDITAANELQAAVELFFDLVEMGGLPRTIDKLTMAKVGLTHEDQEQHEAVSTSLEDGRQSTTPLLDRADAAPVAAGAPRRDPDLGIAAIGADAPAAGETGATHVEESATTVTTPDTTAVVGSDHDERDIEDDRTDEHTDDLASDRDETDDLPFDHDQYRPDNDGY